jgi:hypothetical protein
MKVVSVGSRSFAASMAALGILGFVYGDFAMVWQEVPNWVPGRELLAYVCAAIMFFCGVGLMLPRMARLASGVLLIYLVLWLLLLRVPKVLVAPGVVVQWSSCGETAIYVAAGWALFAALFGSHDHGSSRFFTGDRAFAAQGCYTAWRSFPAGLLILHTRKRLRISSRRHGFRGTWDGRT